MKCTLCNRAAKKREAFWALSWKKVDIAEYQARKEDGRTLWIEKVCFECLTATNNRPPLGLKDINKIRKRGITEEQYYKEHGYKINV